MTARWTTQAIRGFCAGGIICSIPIRDLTLFIFLLVVLVINELPEDWR